MFRDLFLILFRPSRTLDRLLEERNMRKSWGATWIMVGLTCLSMLLFVPVAILFSKSQNLDQGPFTDLTGFAVGGIIVLLLVLAGAVCNAIYFVIARYAFAWMARAGLRIVAGDRYPQTEEERSEKGQLLELIHPYTLAISMWPQLLTFLIYMLAAVAAGFAGSDQTPDGSVIMSIVTTLLAILLYAVSVGAQIYMIIVRVMAIKKIYHVSTPKAFFGPFLMYLIPYVLLFVLVILLILAIVSIGQSHLPTTF